MNRLILYYLIAWMILLCGCQTEPENVKKTERQLPIYPDYTDITIPYNIAPLNFLLRRDAHSIRVTVKGMSGELKVHARRKIRFNPKAWRELLEAEKGNRLQVTVLVEDRKGKWLCYPSFYWEVSPDKIDRYLSYRLIEPGYEVWNAIQLCERDLERFDERILADNSTLDRSCMNCHIYGNQDGNLSMFHLRGKLGGTILNRNGKLRKLNLRNEELPHGAVYGDFHPSGRFAVFSTNAIIPAFHSLGSQRLEVYDTTSDLVIADFDRNELLFPADNRSTQSLETFPTFSPDGKWIYFCQTTAPKHIKPDSVSQLHYSLCRIAFSAEERSWGTEIDTLWNAQTEKGSACYPKVSPDGNYLLFTVANYGTFPIWHQETDLRMLDLRTGAIHLLENVRSDRSDTYHSWSSNSRWFTFASKRDDGLYGKPYFAYIDSAGNVCKPFAMPQADPDHYDNTLKSYNIPELSATKLPFDAEAVDRIYRNVQAEPFKSNKR